MGCMVRVCASAQEKPKLHLPFSHSLYPYKRPKTSPFWCAPTVRLAQYIYIILLTRPKTLFSFYTLLSLRLLRSKWKLLFDFIIIAFSLVLLPIQLRVPRSTQKEWWPANCIAASLLAKLHDEVGKRVLGPCRRTLN